MGRLDEIDAECGKDGPWIHTVGGCTFTFDEPPRDIADKRWLVARIRAMEDVIIALEAVETKAEKDKDSSYVDQWALLPVAEMDAVWAALSAYRMAR